MLIWWLDDDEYALATLRWELEERNVSIRTFTTADDLLDCLESTDETPSLVITDVLVPFHDPPNLNTPKEKKEFDVIHTGISVARHLASHPRSADWPVVILTNMMRKYEGLVPGNIVAWMSKHDYSTPIESADAIIASISIGKDIIPEPAQLDPTLLLGIVHHLGSVLLAGRANVRKAMTCSGKERADALDRAEALIEEAMDEVERANLIDAISRSTGYNEAHAPAEAVPHLARELTARLKVRTPNGAPSVRLEVPAAPNERRLLAITASALHYVLAQLIGNGIRYSSGRKPRVTVRLQWKGDGVTITVTNSGRTVSNSEISRVGTFGWRSRKAARLDPSGSGAGLWLVQKLVAQIDGRFDFDTDDVKDVSFTSVFIPWSK